MDAVETVETVEQAQPDAAPALSILDHAKQFGPNADKAEAAAEDTDGERADDLKPIRPVDQQKRDQGKFSEGKRPMRSKDAVARINELTARAKTAEERAVASESRLAQMERELAEMRAQGASPQAIQRAEDKIERVADAAAEADPEPTEDDPQFAGDYGKYLRALSKWEGRNAARELYQRERTAEQQRQQAQREAATRHEAMSSWVGRMKAAEARYPDWPEVISQPAPWLDPRTGTALPDAIAVDAFIMESPHGPDVLYYLQSNRQEVDALLAMKPLEQLTRLALISQRFVASPEGRSSGVTGSLTKPRTVTLAPPPPNPVRTEPERTNGPVPLDGSLSVLKHAKTFRRA